MSKLATGPMVSSALRVAIVGTGTCVPRLDRGGPCTLVRGGGVALAVDLGLGALHGLLRLGVSHRDLDGILLTHFHPDHTAELASFLFAANYDETPRTTPLAAAGGPGLCDFLSSFEHTYGRWVAAQRYDLRIRELAPGDRLTLGALACRVGPVRHTGSSLAYRFEVGGRSVAVTGDTGPCAGLVEFVRGADILVAEASLVSSGPSDVHLTARQAGELGREAQVGRLVLTHLYPAADAGSPAEAAAEAFGDEVVVARDGMELMA